ncbi:hypothetical protein CLIB1444_06S03906 [[Candida] jaroonii]|uniref:Uncharacterized protein n=1 Tax=[Candida] jaroonii TaxID=467808 RepID=A0ACA9YA43_9ASCO|nr:hypothetical protein CLIB1444_06S03906 [[Candida] jaroonii]
MISFSINYNNQSKKVSINKNKTVSDLTELGCSKFNLNYGELYYQQKKLNSLDAIKYTNLINNSKLVLKPIELSEKDVNVKIFKPNGESLIKKISNKLTMSDILKDLGLNENHTVSILNKSLSGDFGMSLGSLIGENNNVVMRVSEVKEDSVEQRKIVEQQLKAQQIKNEQLRQKRELEEAEREQRLRESRKNDMEVDEPVRSPEQSENSGVDSQDVDSFQEEKSVIQPTEQQSAPVETPIQETTSDYNETVEEDIAIYKPSSTKIYENPDEDYEFTANHAKIYQQSIKYKQPTRKAATIPESYHVRIRFPNKYLLEIRLPNTSKFGELIKKIDENLTDSFKSNYILKLSYPPFTKISIDFTTNNKLLSDLKFDGKMILIWESEKSGDYLVESNVKDFDSLPEVRLENMRSNLPDEVVKVKQAKESSTGKPKDKKVPKWLKIGK